MFELKERDYKQMLLDRTKKRFLEWQDVESISEKELYGFLHMLKGTSGTIGMEKLSNFSSSQLQKLSIDSENRIPVHTLDNFKSRIIDFFEVEDESSEILFSDIQNRKFTEETTVLLIDDDLEFVSYIKELLEKMGAQVIIAMDGKRGIEQFYSTRPNYLLIDVHLPDMSGFDILEHIAEAARERYVTVAIISVEASNENRIAAFENGAMDFIKKPIDPEIFIPYVLNRESMRKTIEKSTITDGLTGIGNRRHFDEMISHHKELADRSGLGFSLVMLDLDHFKQVNDVFGHPAGDEVLKKLGVVAKNQKRETDYVFRYGGEEFVFLLSGETPEEASHFLDRIRDEFNATVFKAREKEFSVTFSAGIAAYEGDCNQLISAADRALYEAKRSGRNRTVIFNENTTVDQKKLTIIIVDDDKLIRSMLTEKLLNLTLPNVDISVIAFEDGPSLLDAGWYRKEEYYIILLDGILPGMDGLEVLGRVKSEHPGTNILISMMTGRTAESDIKAALWLGADDYIMKPFKPEDVVNRVKQLSGRIIT